jgi:hypothetical protein
MNSLKVVGALWGALAVREIGLAFVSRRKRRRDVYAEAMSHAQSLGVPLLVVGDPDTGFVTRFFGRDYGCGDVCTDLTGCPQCPVGVRGSLEEVLAGLPTASHVIAVQYTLEYVPNLPEAIRELERVAVPCGLHVGLLEPGSLTSRFWFGGHWIIDDHDPWRYRHV